MLILKGFFGRSSRFFTLIELLVVVSIISVLSSVGVGGMQAARTKAADGSLKETLSSARNQAGIYYSTTGSYGNQATTTGFSNWSAGVFSDPKMVEVITAAERLSGQQVSYVANETSYSLSVPLKSDPTKSWCVDSMGNVGVIDGTILSISCVAARATVSSGGSGSSSSPCAASGACAQTASGSTCTTYSAATVVSPEVCSTVAISSVCTNGVWSTTPDAYVSCSVNALANCPAYGACGVTAHGGTCSSYSASTVTSPSVCSSVAISSLCSNGTWSITPGLSASCSVEVLPQLSSLRLVKGGPTYAVSPTFSSGTYSYSVHIPSYGTMSVTPTAISATASITVNGAPASSGMAKLVSVTAGSNTITIDVTEGGITKTYSILVLVP